jgi:hypothetical protein
VAGCTCALWPLTHVLLIASAAGCGATLVTLGLDGVGAHSAAASACVRSHKHWHVFRVSLLAALERTLAVGASNMWLDACWHGAPLSPCNQWALTDILGITGSCWCEGLVSIIAVAIVTVAVAFTILL